MVLLGSRAPANHQNMASHCLDPQKDESVPSGSSTPNAPFRKPSIQFSDTWL
jgi:hypothetical protein